MSYQIFNDNNHAKLINALLNNTWIIACFCAEWCSTCRIYANHFKILANYHFEYYFTWIDIENQNNLLDDFDINNFPTLLIQRGTTVSFFGVIEPHIELTKKLLKVQTTKSYIELQDEIQKSIERQQWQKYNLQIWLKNFRQNEY